MKKAMALLLTLAALLGTLLMPASAQQSGVDAEAMVQALGIMQGDASGNLNLGASVTRAEFCKMLVAASSFKDSVGGSSGYSLFKDVKRNHWAVEYIKVCVDNGWFTGYTDGTFRPGNPIKLEEAASAVLRLLGYTSADLAGSYPTAQLSKFDALGLHAGYATARGQLMTRANCADLFYNLMAATNKAGMNYATTLGYKTDASGNVDYATLVTSNTKGPYTLQSGTIASQLDFTPTAVYRNGKASNLTAAADYDVYYYNANLRTVWIYAERVTGTYTAAAPSTAAPTAVTVAGRQYTVDSSAAAYKLSSQGDYAIGDTVTLLLGMNGGVADVCDSTVAVGYYCGMVTGTEAKSFTDVAGKVTATNVATVACTDGLERTYETGATKFTKGVLVQARGASTLTTLPNSTFSGQVSADGKTMGGKAFAADVQILETDQDGAYARIYPSRLAGANLPSSNVLYCETNAEGQISHLILRNATGDLNTYAMLTKANEISASMALAGSYEYLLNGQAGVLLSPNLLYNVKVGGVIITMDGTTVESIKNLSEAKLATVSGLTSTDTAGQRYAISESCQVYICRDSDYFTANMATVTDGSYSLSGYYDNLGCPAGKQVRVIVATAK